MSDREVTTKDVQRETVGTPESGSSALEAVVAGQSPEQAHQAQPSDLSTLKKIGLDNFSIGMADKERAEAIANANKSLDAMVKGDLPYLRERMQQLGISTAELDAMEKKLTAQVEAAKPVQEAILKGDIKSLQKMVTEMKPEQLQQITELLNKHFDRAGIGVEVDFTDGKLIISRTNGDRAVLISKDKLDVIGVNRDGSYDFNRHYRRENPGTELQGMADGALADLLYRHRYYKSDLSNSAADAIKNFGIGASSALKRAQSGK